MMDSECQTRMAHSNYGQTEQHAPPHTGLEVLNQLQDARVKFLEQGLIVLQVASTSMETQDKKTSLLFERLATVLMFSI